MLLDASQVLDRYARLRSALQYPGCRIALLEASARQRHRPTATGFENLDWCLDVETVLSKLPDWSQHVLWRVFVVKQDRTDTARELGISIRTLVRRVAEATAQATSALRAYGLLPKPITEPELNAEERAWLETKKRCRSFRPSTSPTTRKRNRCRTSSAPGKSPAQLLSRSLA